MARPSPAELLAPCGIYCPLCPRYQSRALTRCLGCRWDPHREFCPEYRCITRRGLAHCNECEAYPCADLEVFFAWDSEVTHRPCPEMLRRLDENPRRLFRELRGRERLLEQLLGRHDDEPSRSLFCRAAALLPPAQLEQSLASHTADNGCRARVLALAKRARIDLALRRPAPPLRVGCPPRRRLKSTGSGLKGSARIRRARG